jgi:hypothetical protein
MTDTDQEREDEVLRRMLRTPPSPRKTPQHFVALEGKLFIADNIRRKGGSMTADLYRNVTEFQAGRAMERAASLVEDQLSPAQ